MKLVWVVCVFALLFVAGPAYANPGFPNEIATQLSLTCSQPDCTLCHSGDPGNCGTVIRPFGLWLMSQGITCADQKADTASSIDPLLDQAKTTQVDTNCDGIPDIEQITMCDWQALEQNECGADGGPNGDAAIAPVENVISGCSASPAPIWPGVAGFAVAGALVTIVSRRRRRAEDPTEEERPHRAA